MSSLLEHLHPTPANTPFHKILQQDSANPAALWYFMVHFAVVILTLLKAFSYYGFGQ
jgi:hypothetical protein